MSAENEAGFDYGAPAELYFPVSASGRGGIGYRRFASAAKALDFAFTLLGARLAASALEVDGVRYDAPGMQRLQTERLGG